MTLVTKQGLFVIQFGEFLFSCILRRFGSGVGICFWRQMTALNCWDDEKANDRYSLNWTFKDKKST
jgi:hypothetical protein